jgi:hypothetical protein
LWLGSFPGLLARNKITATLPSHALVHSRPVPYPIPVSLQGLDFVPQPEAPHLRGIIRVRQNREVWWHGIDLRAGPAAAPELDHPEVEEWVWGVKRDDGIAHGASSSSAFSFSIFRTHSSL